VLFGIFLFAMLNVALGFALGMYLNPGSARIGFWSSGLEVELDDLNRLDEEEEDESEDLADGIPSELLAGPTPTDQVKLASENAVETNAATSTPAEDATVAESAGQVAPPEALEEQVATSVSDDLASDAQHTSEGDDTAVGDGTPEAEDTPQDSGMSEAVDAEKAASANPADIEAAPETVDSQSPDAKADPEETTTSVESSEVDDKASDESAEDDSSAETNTPAEEAIAAEADAVAQEDVAAEATDLADTTDLSDAGETPGVSASTNVADSNDADVTAQVLDAPSDATSADSLQATSAEATDDKGSHAEDDDGPDDSDSDSLRATSERAPDAEPVEGAESSQVADPAELLLTEGSPTEDSLTVESTIAESTTEPSTSEASSAAASTPEAQPAIEDMAGLGTIAGSEKTSDGVDEAADGEEMDLLAEAYHAALAEVESVSLPEDADEEAHARQLASVHEQAAEESGTSSSDDQQEEEQLASVYADLIESTDIPQDDTSLADMADTQRADSQTPS
jgi:hypothetical protein